MNMEPKAKKQNSTKAINRAPAGASQMALV